MIAIVLLMGIIIGYLILPNDDCPWGKDHCICRNPMSCNIEWEDGTFQFKSRRVELGTINPGESKKVKIGPLADYERGFKHGRQSQHDYKAEFQTSEFQWTGYMEDLAEILCEQEGIVYEVNEPTLGYKIVCPKCICGGGLYQQEHDGSMYYGFHHMPATELTELKSDESVDLSVEYRGQTYCAKCLYPIGTDWKIIDLTELDKEGVTITAYPLNVVPVFDPNKAGMKDGVYFTLTGE